MFVVLMVPVFTNRGVAFIVLGFYGELIIFLWWPPVLVRITIFCNYFILYKFCPNLEFISLWNIYVLLALSSFWWYMFFEVARLCGVVCHDIGKSPMRYEWQNWCKTTVKNICEMTFSLSVFNEYVPYRKLYKACRFSSFLGELSPALQFTLWIVCQHFSHIHHWASCEASNIPRYFTDILLVFSGF